MLKTNLLLVLIFIFMSPLNAEELDSYCTQRAFEAVTELRQEHYPKITKRESEIARKTALIMCIDNRSVETSSTINTDKISSSEKDTSPPKKKRWIDKLLENEHKKYVSPMMKAHRTGGK